jgi:hypothetical protein
MIGLSLTKIKNLIFLTFWTGFIFDVLKSSEFYLFWVLSHRFSLNAIILDSTLNSGMFKIIQKAIESLASIMFSCYLWSRGLKVGPKKEQKKIVFLVFFRHSLLTLKFLIRELHLLFFFGIFSYLHGLIRTYFLFIFRKNSCLHCC